MKRQQVDALAVYYETLTRQSVSELSRYYAADCRFRDPFNDVRGIAALAAIFTHMFDTLESPRFIVKERVAEGDQVLLTWDFEFRFRNWRPQVTQRIHGSSLFTFNDAGLVSEHRDYWDAAEELYEKLPLIGALLRWFKRMGRPKTPH
jgi:steroid delta-isomerase